MHDSGQRICLFSRSLELKIFALCERLNSNRHESLLLAMSCTTGKFDRDLSTMLANREN